MDKLLKVLKLPREVSAADKTSQDMLQQELQERLDNFDFSFQPAIRSVQLLLLYNDDAARLFSNLSPIMMVENKVRLWIYDSRRGKITDKEEVQLNRFKMNLWPPVRRYCERGDESLELLDL